MWRNMYKLHPTVQNTSIPSGDRDRLTRKLDFTRCGAEFWVLSEEPEIADE